MFDLVVSLLELLVVIQMFTETLVSTTPGRELTCLLNDAHPGKYSGIRPKSIYSGESTLAVGETFEEGGESFLQIRARPQLARAVERSSLFISEEQEGGG